MRRLIYFITAAMLLSASCTSNKTFVSTTVTNDASKPLNESERYIHKYYPMAVQQMRLHGIPASITLAQALLEGGAGRSDLVKNANNHFGVKADKRWSGRTYSKWDNGKWCQFRVYKSTEESFEDHSKFLLSNSRYDFLFRLDSDDYKGWAKGLKEAGYAEDKQYHNKLISIIERYGLQQYDTIKKKNGKENKAEVSRTHGENVSKTISKPAMPEYDSSNRHELLKMNGLIYTIANDGDTFKKLSKELGISRRKLRIYNDLYKGYELRGGDIIYLEKKNNKAQRGNKRHTVQEGESLYRISQSYGIKLKKLYKMNPIYKENARLRVGDVIRLR